MRRFRDLKENGPERDPRRPQCDQFFYQLQRRILSLTHTPFFLPPLCTRFHVDPSSPGVYLAQINERTVPGTEGERRNVQLMGPGIFVRLSAILVFQVLGVSRIRLDRRRIDARGSCFIYSNSSGPVFPLSTRSRRPLICLHLEAWGFSRLRGRGPIDLLVRGKETRALSARIYAWSGFVELLIRFVFSREV